MLVKGLKNINKHIDDEEEKFNRGSGPKWFGLNDKQSATVQFLQELDEDSPNFSEKNGLAFLAIEHVHPTEWKNRALCTADEGACYGCEQHKKDFKAGWRSKNRLYANVLFDNGVDEPEVRVLAQGNGPKSITPALIEIAGDLGTITDTLFKVKRNGKGRTDTQYVLTQRGKTDNNPEEYELFDLDKVVRHIPYDEQEEYYNRNVTPATEPEESVANENAAEAEWV